MEQGGENSGSSFAKVRIAMESVKSRLANLFNTRQPTEPWQGY